jgi:dGTPase
MQWEKLLSHERYRPTQRVEGEMRDEFERDYGRALYSTPVRRLRDKAQVFPLEPHDSVRTRLAHSLEVSSVAEGLATHAARLIAKQEHLTDQQQRDIACIARTCGIIHDLGNPPFGHAGELAIATWFRDRLKNDNCFRGRFERELTKQQQEDFLAFEGNAQTIRLVCHLQLLTDQLGLNFTFGTLSAASKYLAPSDAVSKHGPHQRRKPGYFASEQKKILTLREATGTGDRRNPIAYLVEAD